jgi:hypothetical protein
VRALRASGLAGLHREGRDPRAELGERKRLLVPTDTTDAELARVEWLAIELRLGELMEEIYRVYPALEQLEQRRREARLLVLNYEAELSWAQPHPW